MELHYLTTFLTVCEHGSISQAAKQLYLTQTTVTNRIKELEKELGVLLFERVGRKIRLTPGGNVFISYAKKVLSIMEEAVHKLDKHSQPEGTIKLASISNICTYVLPDWIARFRQRYPQIEIKTETEHSRPIVDQVLKASIDIGLVRGPIGHNGLITYPLCYENVIPIVHSAHPWSGKRIHVKQLNNKKLVAYNHFSRTWEKLEQWFDRHNISMNINMDLDFDETSKLMILNGHGITFLPFYTVEKELLQGKLATFDLEPPLDLSIKTYLIYNRRNPLPSHVKLLIDFLLEMSLLEGRFPHES